MIFKTFKRMKNEDSLNNIFVNAYKKENSILEGIDVLIKKIHKYQTITLKVLLFSFKSF